MRNLIHYSVNTKIANFINIEYYNDVHYVWTAPYFDCKERNPTSSNPKEIYSSLIKDIKSGVIDYHSRNVEGNRIGLKKGAMKKHEKGDINKDKMEEIIELSQKANFELFAPLIYIIPYDKIHDRISTPHFSHKAHPMSIEYIIEDLQGKEFDIIEL
jgi:hypothetical protein